MIRAKKYQALTNLPFLLSESALLAERLLQGESWPVLRTEAREGRLFGTGSAASQITFLRGLQVRLEGQTPEVLTLLSGGTLEVRQQVNLALILQQRPLLQDFIAEVLVPKLRAFDDQVTEADVRSFLGRKAEQEPDVAAWSPATLQKTRSTLTRFLLDAGLLREGARGGYVTVPQYLAPEARAALSVSAPLQLQILGAVR